MNIVISVPEGTELDNLAPEIQQAITDVGGNWAHSMMPGTRPYGGRTLIMAMVSTSLEIMEGAIAQLGLDWQVVAAQNFYSKIWNFDTTPIISLPQVYRTVHKLDVMNFAEDKLEVSPDTEEVTRRRPTPAEVPSPNKWSGSADWANKDKWIIQVICRLAPEGFSESSGKPNVKDIEALMEGSITAAERDTAWAYIQSLLP